MKNIRILAIILSLSLICGGLAMFVTTDSANAQTKTKSKKKKKHIRKIAPKTMPKTDTPSGSMPKVEDASKIPNSPNDGVTMLLSNDGGNGKPFVFVARDAKTYSLLQKKFPALPTASTIDFKTNIVVAAFLGTKPTGGYGVKINKIGNAVQISPIEPPKDAMLTMSLTNPFAVAKIEFREDEMLPIRVGESWTKDLKSYQITASDFVSSGGFIGRSQKIDLQGTINISQMDNFVTAELLISRKGAESGRQMKEFATGFVEPNGAITFEFMNTGNLIDVPSAPLKASGKLTENSLVLTFESLPTMVADGFEGSGKIEAKK